jgi:Zn-dependent peptidase ImmA (M78 family)
LAHEIGHFFLHQGEEVIVDRAFRVNLRNSEAAKAESPEEIEANYFAAELLMPTKFLLEDLEGKAIDIEGDDDIRELSSRYQVSSQALSYRLTNLGYLHQ